MIQKYNTYILNGPVVKILYMKYDIEKVIMETGSILPKDRKRERERENEIEI
jgi:hypothetical protein